MYDLKNKTSDEILEHIHQLENQISRYKKENQSYSDMIQEAPIGIATITPSGRITSANPFFCNLLGYTEKELLERSVEDITHPEDMVRERIKIKEMLENKYARVTFEKRYIKKNGQYVWAQLVTSSILTSGKNNSFGLGMVIDIDDRKKVEEEKEILITDLQNVISENKILKGLLPICAICKKIRNEDGRWDIIESYIENHSNAQFTHSICPECVRKHYPEAPQTPQPSPGTPPKGE